MRSNDNNLLKHCRTSEEVLQITKREYSDDGFHVSRSTRVCEKCKNTVPVEQLVSSCCGKPTHPNLTLGGK